MTKLITLQAWAAFLGLPAVEREPFLTAASAFSIAASAMQGEPSVAVQAAPVVARRAAVNAPRARQPIETRTMPAPAILTGAKTVSVPLIGGAALDLAPRADFSGADFIRRWRPGVIIHAYAASVAGLGSLMRPLGQCAYSVGVDSDGDHLQAIKAGTAGDLSARMLRHGRLGHASVSKADPKVPSPGFTSWRAEPLPVAKLDPSPMSPVAVRGDCLEIVLPATMSPEAFDRRFAAALAGASLAGWAMSAEGHAICHAQGIDPQSLVRGTPKPDGGVAWCNEIVLIRVRHDALRLLRLCEQIVLDHMAAESLTDDAIRGDADAAAPASRPRARRQPETRGSASATPVGSKKTGRRTAR